MGFQKDPSLAYKENYPEKLSVAAEEDYQVGNQKALIFLEKLGKSILGLLLNKKNSCLTKREENNRDPEILQKFWQREIMEWVRENLEFFSWKSWMNEVQKNVGCGIKFEENVERVLLNLDSRRREKRRGTWSSE